MTEFDQRLAPEFFDRVQTRVRERMAEEGFDAFLTDSPEDIAYLTGFFHHPSERPVAVWLEATGRVVMLLPELEREYAQSQSSRAELVSFFEFPGVVAPFEVLARAVTPRGRVGFTSTMPYSRLVAAREAMPGADLVGSDLVTRTRFVKFPEEVVLHREAARITDRMLDAGVALVTEAIGAGGDLPTEAELERHVTAAGAGIMYAEHHNVVVASLLAGGLVYSGANCCRWDAQSVVASSKASAPSCWASPQRSNAVITTRSMRPSCVDARPSAPGSNAVRRTGCAST